MGVFHATGDKQVELEGYIIPKVKGIEINVKVSLYINIKFFTEYYGNGLLWWHSPQ